MTRFLSVRISLLVFTLSSLSFAHAAEKTKLYPSVDKPMHNTPTLVSAEKRVGNGVYEVFYLRNLPKREAFRVDVGSYDNGQLVRDWNHGIIFEKDMNRDENFDYVWYGGDDTGQRLLWFLSKGDHYDCVNLFKSAEAVWKKRFSGAAPDLGEVFGDSMVEDVSWDSQAKLLYVSVAANQYNPSKAHRVRLIISPDEFVMGVR